MNTEKTNFEKAEKMVSLLKEGHFNIFFDESGYSEYPKRGGEKQWK